MLSLANRNPFLGLANPLIGPALSQLAPAQPSAAASAAGGDKAALLGGALVVGGLALTSALFSYGVAKETKSKMVRTSGYILAAASGLTAALYVVGGPLIAMLNGSRR